MNYIENHFSGGYGVHVMTILPGPHVKAQYYPINFDRFKVYGEVRGELLFAPLVGSNYNIQVASRIFHNIGVHGGIGQWNYISALKSKEPGTENEPFPKIKTNSFEFGITWLGLEDAVVDIYTSIPATIDDSPLLIVGGSITLGFVWWNKRKSKKEVSMI